MTDSLSLPRKYDTGEVDYEQTYIPMLRKRFPDILIVDVAMGGAKITDLLVQCFYYKQFKPDLVFMQCGIVDCAPRSFSLLEKVLIEKFRLRKFSRIFEKKFRKFRNCTYTNKTVFLDSLLKIRMSFENVPFFSVGILQVCEQYEILVPGIKKNVREYNHILKENTNYINNDDFPLDGIISDFHHLNELGHKLIFEKLENVINAQVGSDFSSKR
ncbi:SGNH/GDSL hydrolase family protein [Flavobacterium sp. Fl-318]|uniref:SGNH/GDSL hydrolase family protein n=1 Tax=Flavobacterium cupriresistens TaxID=2893885 RepID=A0ABU4RFE6_9FLAO|nr:MULTISPECIES: SGNH/GDSL hydrolase family protein [unclassified Flavobacterium]MDX6190125.1 SGNH/GDSL hydrolase family protein [Flavobacterium sp. Fl-318]UFH42946.1 SGNH/GDSL hydrolase family protein [Flavobacterium sp. F-323]